MPETRDTVGPPAGQPGPVRVLVTYRLLKSAIPDLAAAATGASIEYRPLAGRAAIDALRDADLEVLVAPFAPHDLSRTPRLRWVQLASAGVDHLLDDPPWARGLLVTNARGVYAPSIGQYVLAEILRINEHVDGRRALQVEHRWPGTAEHESLTGRLVRGRTVLVLGYGGVGREIARLADAVGMRVLAAKRRPDDHHDRSFRVPGTGDPDASIPEQIVAVDDLPALLPEADYVVVTVPLTDRSRGLVSARLIGAMREDAWLINIARGPVVDEGALVRALRDRRIGGAVLDVFGEEPLPPDSPFWDLPNVIVTPHVSGGDASSPHILADLVADNLRRYLSRDPLVNVVDAEHQY